MTIGAYNSYGVNEAQYNGFVTEYTFASAAAGAVAALADAKIVAKTAACALGSVVTNAVAKVMADTSAVLSGVSMSDTATKVLPAVVGGVSGVVCALTDYVTRRATGDNISGLALMSLEIAQILRAVINRTESYAGLTSGAAKAGLSSNSVYAGLDQPRTL